MPTPQGAPGPHADIAPLVRFSTWPARRKPGYGWGRVVLGFVALLGGVVLVSLAAAVALATAQSGPMGPIRAVLSSAVPVAVWSVATLVVARAFFGMRPGDLLSWLPGMRWGVLGRALVVSLGLYAVGLQALEG